MCGLRFALFFFVCFAPEPFAQPKRYLLGFTTVSNFAFQPFLISSGLASVTKWSRFISLFSSNATKSVDYVHAMPLPFVVSLAFWSGRILNCLPLWFILKRYFEILIETNLPLSYLRWEFRWFPACECFVPCCL